MMGRWVTDSGYIEWGCWLVLSPAALVMHTSFLRGRGEGHKNDRSDVTPGTGSSGSPSLGALLHCGAGE